MISREDKAIRVLLVEDDEDDYVLTRQLLAAVGQCLTVGWVGALSARGHAK